MGFKMELYFVSFERDAGYLGGAGEWVVNGVGEGGEKFGFREAGEPLLCSGDHFSRLLDLRLRAA